MLTILECEWVCTLNDFYQYWQLPNWSLLQGWSKTVITIYYQPASLHCIYLCIIILLLWTPVIIYLILYLAFSKSNPENEIGWSIWTTCCGQSNFGFRMYSVPFHKYFRDPKASRSAFQTMVPLWISDSFISYFWCMVALKGKVLCFLVLRRMFFLKVDES